MGQGSDVRHIACLSSAPGRRLPTLKAGEVRDSTTTPREGTLGLGLR